jgi:hypothetical protein
MHVLGIWYFFIVLSNSVRAISSALTLKETERIFAQFHEIKYTIIDGHLGQ